MYALNKNERTMYALKIKGGYHVRIKKMKNIYSCVNK